MSERRWIFEPHGAFRSGVAGEDWPLGYLSEGPGEPVFALHEVIGERSAKKLRLDAELIVKAVNAYQPMLEALEALVLAGHRPGLGQCCDAADKGIAAIALAKGEAA